jgi:hypothetical protein
MADYTPIFTGGQIPFTMQASGAVTGGTLLAMTTTPGQVSTAGVSALCIGVAAHDAATGTKITVWPIDGVTHEITVLAATTITAGDGVISAAGGLVNTSAVAAAAAAGTLLGIAETTATAPAVVRFVGRQ